MTRILVIRIGRLGDTILATPVIEVLQGVFGPDVVIDFAASPGASTAVLKLDQRVNRVFPIDHRRVPWRLNPSKRMLRKHSRSLPYDLVINLECGKECDDFFGFVQAGEFCGRPLAQPRHVPGRHCVDTEKTIYANRLGTKISSGAGPSLLTTHHAEFSPLVGVGAFVVINPGFSGLMKGDYRSHRAWPVNFWSDLIGLITQRMGVTVVINGTTEERRFFEPLLALPGTLSLFGSPLETLVDVLAKATCLVSVDTGTLHVATALGTPVVALFGPTVPELTGPYSKKVASRVLRSGIECQPCLGTPEQKKCVENRCMRELKPETIYQSVIQLAHPANAL